MAKLRETGFALALAVGIVLALVVGIVYSITASSRRLATDAESLHATHEMVQAATVVRSQVELAAFQVALRSEGVGVDAVAIDSALAHADTAADQVVAAHQVLDTMGSSTPELASASSGFEAGTRQAVAALATGVVIATDDVDSRYEELIAELAPVRDGLVVAVSSSERSNAWSSTIAAFLAVFAIPASVITAYFVLDRRRRRQHELEVALEAERAAHESREQFLNTVFHELRKPLTGVRGIAQMLGGDEALMGQPRMSDLHALLVGELDDMTSLVDDLLTASRLEGGGLEYAMEPVDVKGETRTLLDSLNHRGASIYFAMDDGIVNADRRRLRQIVRNLLSNALKYGGPNIEVKGLVDDDSYTVVIVDDGQGVPRAVEDQLFTRFVHDRDGSPSVGLGLSIVMALAVGMGGTAFHSREDGLTRFGVRLPKAAEAVKAAHQYEPPTITPVTRAAG